MRMRALVIIGLAVFGVGVLALVSNHADSSSTQAKKTSPGKSQYTVHEACDILTPAIAQHIAGNDAAATANDTSSDSIVVSNCSYFSSSNKLSVGLLAPL